MHIWQNVSTGTMFRRSSSPGLRLRGTEAAPTTPTDAAAKAVGRHVPQLNKMYRAPATKPMKGLASQPKQQPFVHCISNLPRTVRMKRVVVTAQIRDMHGNERQDEIL